MSVEHASNWPMGFAPSAIGRVHLQSGREVFWTGKVAIGLNHEKPRDHTQPVPHSTLWLQELLLETKAPA